MASHLELARVVLVCIEFLPSLPHWVHMALPWGRVGEVCVELDILGDRGGALGLYRDLLTSLVGVLLVQCLELMLQFLTVSLVELALPKDVTLLLRQLILGGHECNIVHVRCGLWNSRGQELL